MSAERPKSKPAPRKQDAEPVAKEEERATGAFQREQAEREIGGPEGPEPTRYGDWERGGRCIDF